MTIQDGPLLSVGPSYLQKGYAVAFLSYSLIRNSSSRPWIVCNDPFLTYQDLSDSIHHLIQHATDYSIDPRKITLSGFSAGGHLAAHYATTCNNMQKNHTCPLATALHFPFLRTGAQIFCSSPGSAFSNNQDYADCFPTASVRPGMPPVVLYHASGDPIVPSAWMEEFVGALESKNVPHEFYQVQGGGHYTVPFQQVVDVSNGVFSTGDGYETLVERAMFLAQGGDCVSCDNVATSYMNQQGMNCAEGTWYIENRCNADSNWVSNKYCRKSCYLAGRAYPNDNCCVGTALVS